MEPFQTRPTGWPFAIALHSFSMKIFSIFHLAENEIYHRCAYTLHFLQILKNKINLLPFRWVRSESDAPMATGSRATCPQWRFFSCWHKLNKWILMVGTSNRMELFRFDKKCDFVLFINSMLVVICLGTSKRWSINLFFAILRAANHGLNAMHWRYLSANLNLFNHWSVARIFLCKLTAWFYSVQRHSLFNVHLDWNIFLNFFFCLIMLNGIFQCYLCDSRIRKEWILCVLNGGQRPVEFRIPNASSKPESNDIWRWNGRCWYHWHHIIRFTSFLFSRLLLLVWSEFQN